MKNNLFLFDERKRCSFCDLNAKITIMCKLTDEELERVESGEEDIMSPYIVAEKCEICHCVSVIDPANYE